MLLPNKDAGTRTIAIAPNRLARDDVESQPGRATNSRRHFPITVAISSTWEERVRKLAEQRGVTEQEVVEDALRRYFTALDSGFTPQERAEFEAWERAADGDFARLSQEHDWPWQP